jgi:hypothetical protein
VLVTSAAVDGVTHAVDLLLAQACVEQPDVVVLSDTEQLLTLRSRIDAALAKRLAVIDSRDATVEACGRGTRGWLVEELCLEGHSASRKLRVARQLHRWPATEAAWVAGDISEEHVLVLLAALRQVPADLAELVEKSLLELARDSAPHLVAQAVDAILVACGVENDSDAVAARRYGTRGVTVATTFGGTGSLSGTLTAVLTDKITRALQFAGQPAGPEDGRSRAQRFHDALEDIVDNYLDGTASPDRDLGEPAARVVITMDLATLEGRLKSAWALLPAGAQISPATARRLACDAEVIPALLGSGGQVLDLGRSTRTFSPAVRRAALLRDGDRCVFPACQGRRKECHHIIEWADGGASDLDNAAWLCGFHHWLVHEAGWRMKREVDNGYTFTGPAGVIRTSSKIPIHDPPWDP